MFCLMALAVSAQNCQVKESNYQNVQLQFEALQAYGSTVNIDKQDFTQITMKGFQKQQVAGLPTLPTLVKIVEVSLGDELVYDIVAMDCDTVDGSQFGIDHAIVPAQPSRSKSDRSEHQLVMDRRSYSANSFLGNDPIVVEAMGVARDRNLARVMFNPMRWNPQTNQVIIIRNLTVNIHQKHADVEGTRQLQQRYASPAFNSGLEVVNSLGNKDAHTSAPLRYTIVSYSGFRGALDEFADWKRRQGFIVDLVYTNDPNVGNTTSSIKNYLQGLYDNATPTSPAPTYVLLVGDVAQLPAFQLTAYNEHHHSDLSYCCWTGNDYLPDCHYGRFSAQDLSQLTPQISKTMMYEQYTFPDDSYLNTAALIAGVDRGTSGDNAYNYGDPAMDYVAKTYITAANGFSNIVYYKNNTSFAPTGVTVTGSSQASATSSALRTLYNNGCGWVNYTAHGSETSWGDPSFTASNVSQMTNNNKPMVMIGNCCLTNSFQVDACFGEALLRKDNNAGAVGYIGGSNSTYWIEDFYWSVGIRSTINNTCNPNYDANNLGMYDRLFHTHNETFNNWYLTMGAMVQAGNMAVEASSAGVDMKEYYWQIYHLMGDPSLMPYIHGQAQTMQATVPNAITVGCNSLTVSATPYAYIGFTDAQHNLIAAAFADAFGNATLQFDPIANPGTAEVVITAQGYQPYIQNVNIIANGPYVSIQSMTANNTLYADGNVNFDVTLKNVGVNNANNITIEFQNLEGQMLIDTTGTIDLNSGLAIGDELSLHHVCTSHIWGNVADQTVARVKVVVRWGNTANDRSDNYFNFTINASNMHSVEHTLTNNFEADSTAVLTITNKNMGHADLSNAQVTLTCLDPIICIDNPNNTISQIATNQSVNLTYQLHCVDAIPVDRVIPFLQTINDGFKTTKDTITVIIGNDTRFITFEDSTWSYPNWTQGNYPWEITNQNAHNGTFCVRSRTWSTSSWNSNSGNNCSSELSITWTSTANDSITFWKRVSSESDYDFFHFYIDNVEMEAISGEVDWSRSAYAITAGTHTFKFSYQKDGSVGRGSDCTWIDDIHLPSSGSNYTYQIDTICQGSEYTFNGNAIETENLSEGNHIFSDSTATSITYLTLVVRALPQVSISGGDVTIRSGESVRLTASGADQYMWSTGETNSTIDVYPTETTEYTVTGYNGSCSATANTTVTVNGSIGINIAGSDATLRIYPNPAHASLNLDGDDIASIVILDLSGREVMRLQADQAQRTIDISQLNNGVYMLVATDHHGNRTIAKFVKK